MTWRQRATGVYDARGRVRVKRARLFRCPSIRNAKGRECGLRVLHEKIRGTWSRAIKREINGGAQRDLARMARWASDRRMLKPSGVMSAVNVACRHRMLFNSAFITRKTTRRFTIAAGGRVSLRAGFPRTGPHCAVTALTSDCELITPWSRCPLNYNHLIS